ncbi:argininosuccinate lyase, partial [Bacillus cereus group sp. Bce025]
LKDLFQVLKPHITMLMEENLMKKEEAKVILHALKKVEGMPEEQLLYTEQHEDLFFLVEHLISQEAKSNFVSNMHIGRSRNDMGVTMYR